MTYNKLNNITGWIVFAISLVVYMLTVAPTTSFWDCGEFIAVSNELEVPHPPGAPMYLLIGRLFAIFAFGDVERVAFMVNLFSVFSSAFTAVFTFWITTMLGKKLLAPDDANPSMDKTLSLLFAGAVAGLTCTFCDSIWFNAVEAEVYAPSTFFTAVVVWLMLKWESRADEPDHLKWIILIAYVMGLSIGVHLLNLLAIPALTMIYYFRKYRFSWLGFGSALGASIGFLWFCNSFIIKYTFELSWWFERFFTGTYDLSTNLSSGMGMPFGTGTTIFALLLLGTLGGLMFLSFKRKLVWLNTSVLCIVFVYIGFSSYTMLYIRAQKHTPINENDPSNILNFLNYMNREQYGDWPILHGPMYNAQAIAYKDKKPMYYKFQVPQKQADWGDRVDVEKLNTRYVEYSSRPTYEYERGGERFFPRMHKGEKYSGAGQYSYINYVKNKGADPNSPYDDKPTGGENLRFFLEYQFNHMYLRYFAWNFIGREGDEQHRVDDWESGLIPREVWKHMPDYVRDDEARNHYFYLPFILGLLGLAWQYSRNKKDAAVIGALFFFTGLAIILYLNQDPNQPRERDYSYAGSFQTFCIWIGLGVLALVEFLGKVKPLQKIAPYIAGPTALVLVPGIMCAQNWDDHTRAGNYVPPDSAYNMLTSCAKNAILFTNGDNDTFPLWYLQEVEGVRTDIRIVNLSLVNTDWYIHQLHTQMNDSPPLPLTMRENEYMGEKNGVKDAPASQNILLPVDKDALLRNAVIRAADTSKIESPMKWTVTGQKQGDRNYLRKQDLVIMDLLQNISKAGWNRPVYFAVTIPESSFLGLVDYFQLEGMAYRVVPVKHSRRHGNEYVAQDIMHKNVLNYRIRGLDNPNLFFDSNTDGLIANLRFNYLRLAISYVEDIDEMTAAKGRLAGSPDSLAAIEAQISEKNRLALEVVDFAMNNISDKLVRIDPYYLAEFADIYVRVGKPDKGRKLLEDALKRAVEDLTFDTYRNNGAPPRDGNLYSLYRMFMAARTELKDNELSAKIVVHLHDFHYKILKNLQRDQTALESTARSEGSIWYAMFLFYRNDLKDMKKAEEIARNWQELTGDKTMMQELQQPAQPEAIPSAGELDAPQ